MADRIEYQKSEGIAIITLSHPPVNAYSYELMRELDEAVLDARFDSSIHVVVVTGAGERFFCCGADIAMLERSDPEYKYYFCLHANETLRRLEETPKLSIAALQGHCVGGGLEVALACDLRFARRGAGKLGLPEVNLGVLPGTGGTQRLTRLIGKARALQLMVEGSNVSFEQGVELGIINELWEADDARTFLDRVVDYARRFTPPQGPARAVGAIKRAAQAAGEMPLDQGLALERELQAALFASADAREGITAFVQKRQAKFTGK